MEKSILRPLKVIKPFKTLLLILLSLNCYSTDFIKNEKLINYCLEILTLTDNPHPESFNRLYNEYFAVDIKSNYRSEYVIEELMRTKSQLGFMPMDRKFAYIKYPNSQFADGPLVGHFKYEIYSQSQNDRYSGNLKVSFLSLYRAGWVKEDLIFAGSDDNEWDLIGIFFMPAKSGY